MKLKLSLASLLLVASPAFAVPVVDPAGDFLPSYTGPQGGDLDVLTTEAFLNTTTNTISVSTTVNAAIGTTAGSFYVFGFNRGAGTERFVTSTPSVGAGVFFDLVLILRPDGTSQVNDLIAGVNTILPAGSVTVSGNTISSAPLALSLFPTRGFAATDYTFNLWPRVSSVAGTASISDFAPSASNAAVSIIPSPTAAGLLAIAGVFGVGRRRAR
ncbi:MAG: hypothetical protein K2X32_14505 [Phycisphaerales bacterium]|nr:hypothetical protein [Phycisphaerales bacterium]